MCVVLKTGWRPKGTKSLTETQPELWKLIQECFARKPDERPDFQDIVLRLREIGSADPSSV